MLNPALMSQLWKAPYSGQSQALINTIFFPILIAAAITDLNVCLFLSDKD